MKKFIFTVGPAHVKRLPIFAADEDTARQKAQDALNIRTKGVNHELKLKETKDVH